VSDGALCSWEFRYCCDKEPATKKLVTGSVARAKPTGGQLSYGWGDFKPHPHEATTRYTCRAGISVLKLRQYATVSFANREMPAIDLKHARLDFVSHRKHATSLLQIMTSQIRFRGNNRCLPLEWNTKCG
jgi:hypothetical protein